MRGLNNLVEKVIEKIKSYKSMTYDIQVTSESLNISTKIYWQKNFLTTKMNFHKKNSFFCCDTENSHENFKLAIKTFSEAY